MCASPAGSSCILKNPEVGKVLRCTASLCLPQQISQDKTQIQKTPRNERQEKLEQTKGKNKGAKTI